MAFIWNEEKNLFLQRTRGISFERVVVAVGEGKLLAVLEHPNKKKYTSQFIMVVNVEGYAFCVPYVETDNGDYFLKTVFPSRKLTNRYLSSNR